MTKDKKGRQYYVSQETHNQLIAIGRAHGAAEGREASPGIRVAARYHGRLVEALEKMMASHRTSGMSNGAIRAAEDEAKLLLREVEVAR